MRSAVYCTERANGRYMERAVLFDLDGTLTNTLPSLAAATNEALQENGYPVCPVEAYPHMVGDGARMLIERALGNAAAPSSTTQVLRSFLQIYDRDCLRQVALYPGIARTVRVLKERGYHLLVVTNKPQAQAEKIVRHFFGDTLFEGVFGGQDIYPCKPDPTSARLALAAAKTLTENAWFVGDSDVDVLTAQAAGLRSVGAAWGFRGAEELKRAGANVIATCAEDLEKIIPA